MPHSPNTFFDLRLPIIDQETGNNLQSYLTRIGPMKVIPGLYRYIDHPDVVSMNGRPMG